MRPDSVTRFFLTHYPAFAVGVMLMLIVKWVAPFSDAIWLDTLYLSLIALAAWLALSALKPQTGLLPLAFSLLLVVFISFTGQKYLYRLVAYFYWAWMLIYVFALIGGLTLGLGYVTTKKFLPVVFLLTGAASGYIINNHLVLLTLFGLAMLLYYWLSDIKLTVKGLTSLAVILFMVLGYQGETQLFARQKKYTDQVIFSGLTRMHKVDVTTWRGEYWYYLNNQNRLSSLDEYLYHEPLVHPAMHMVPQPERVLILGGEMGGALREVVKYDDIRQVTVLPLDIRLIEEFREHNLFQKISKESWQDGRVTIVDSEIFSYLDQHPAAYDVIIVDLPDPGNLMNNQFYTTEFYQLCRQSLTQNGVIVTQAGSPYFATKAFYTITATMQDAGFHTAPFHNQILTLGEWAWVVGAREKASIGQLDSMEFEIKPLTWLNAEAMQMMLSFGKVTSDTSNIKVNSLKDPSTFIYYVQGNWSLQ